MHNSYITANLSQYVLLFMLYVQEIDEFFISILISRQLLNFHMSDHNDTCFVSFSRFQFWISLIGNNRI